MNNQELTSSSDPLPLIIFGTGGNCIDILETALDINQAAEREVYHCMGFLDDSPACQGKKYHGVPVLGPLHKAKEFGEAYFVNGIGSPNNFWLKEEIMSKSGIARERFVSLVHPSAYVSPSARLGSGVVVLQNATLTSNVEIGDHVIILPNSVVSHGTYIGDYTCITGGVCISGGVRVGKHCYLGSNSTLKGNIQVADTVLVGMGSVVIQDVPTNTVVVGSPAKALRPVLEQVPSAANESS